MYLRYVPIIFNTGSLSKRVLVSKLLIFLHCNYWLNRINNKEKNCTLLTSISSLLGSNGASKMFFKQKSSLSNSKLYLVTSIMRCQWRGFIALFAINSSKGHISLKSSIVFLRAKNAGHSLRLF